MLRDDYREQLLDGVTENQSYEFYCDKSVGGRMLICKSLEGENLVVGNALQAMAAGRHASAVLVPAVLVLRGINRRVMVQARGRCEVIIRDFLHNGMDGRADEKNDFTIDGQRLRSQDHRLRCLF